MLWAHCAYGRKKFQLFCCFLAFGRVIDAVVQLKHSVSPFVCISNGQEKLFAGWRLEGSYRYLRKAVCICMLDTWIVFHRKVVFCKVHLSFCHTFVRFRSKGQVVCDQLERLVEKEVCRLRANITAYVEPTSFFRLILVFWLDIQWRIRGHLCRFDCSNANVASICFPYKLASIVGISRAGALTRACFSLSKDVCFCLSIFTSSFHWWVRRAVPRL